MKEKSKEHSLKEMKLIMTCLTIICFCCTFITIFQNAILCFELGTNRAAIDAGKAAASEQFIWQAFPQGITLLSMAVCSVFNLSDAPQCKAQSDICKSQRQSDILYRSYYRV